MFVIHANFEKRRKVDQKSVLQKITQLISRYLVGQPGYEASNGIVRLLSKVSNTGFSRHIKPAVIYRFVSLLFCMAEHLW